MISLECATNSLERALKVLDLVAQKHSGLTNAEICQYMQIATSSCSYILTRLEREGYVTRDYDNGKYRIGLKVVALAKRALHDLGIRPVAQESLKRLVEETGLTAIIAVLDQGQILLIDKEDSPAPLRVNHDVGEELPFHSTALGKVLAAHLPRKQLLELIDQYGLVRVTEKTVCSKAKLLKELEAVRVRGYATACDEQIMGVRAVAAPIYDADGDLRAAVSGTGSTTQQIWNRPQDVIASIKEAARKISNRAALLRWPNKSSRHG